MLEQNCLNWATLPTLDRGTMPLILFGESCLPGGDRPGGCLPGKAFYSIAIPFSFFAKDGNGTLPTGEWCRTWTKNQNKYLESNFKANLEDPRTGMVLGKMTWWSKKLFVERYGKSPYTTMKVTDLIKQAGGKLAVAYGHATATTPQAGETVATFIRRGGFLLLIHGGPFKASLALERISHRSWMPADMEGYELWASYDPAQNIIGYSIRIPFKGVWSSITSARVLKSYAQRACGVVTDPKVTAAATVAATAGGPKGMIAAAGITGLQTACGIVPVKVPITQLCPTGASAPSTPPSTALPPPPAQPSYPADTIAWLDPATQQYLVAIPVANGQTTHQAVGGALAAMPSGVRQVAKGEWQKATMPWIRRSSTKAGIGAMAVVTAILGASFTIFSNR